MIISQVPFVVTDGLREWHDDYDGDFSPTFSTSNVYTQHLSGWWFGCHFVFSHILGISSSQLTFIFFIGFQTTNQFICVSMCGN